MEPLNPLIAGPLLSGPSMLFGSDDGQPQKDPETGLYRQFDYSMYRPTGIAEEVFSNAVNQIRNAAAVNNFDTLAEQKAAYLAAGGTEEAWGAMQRLAIAETVPGVEVPEGAVLVGAQDSEAQVGAAGTDRADLYANEPGVTGAAGAVAGPQYIGMGDWRPIEGQQAPLYLVGAEVNERPTSPSERATLKQQMYEAGLYGDASPQDILLGTSQWTEGDKVAFTKLLGEANQNLTDWRRALAFRGQASDVFGDDALSPEEEAALVDGGLSFQQEIKQFARANGLDLSDAWIQQRYGQSLDGKISADQVKQKLREKYIANAFPAWKEEILMGEDVESLASPYAARMESMLELPPGSIGLDDPLLRRAIQGVDANGKPAIVPLYQFEHEVRTDPRYADSLQGMREENDLLEASFNKLRSMYG